jgi:stage V sporulation protein R
MNFMDQRTWPISGKLLKLQKQIEEYARGYGLDYYEVRFEVCDYDTINILAAQGGFPARYPHWRFGMDYDQLSKGFTYGLQKIYEMVVNTNPCYAYLLNANNLVDQKIVMGHVYGHADFFKNNAWFTNTNKSMMDVFANHGTKIRRYMDTYGADEVEHFIDKVHSLENLLDIGQLFETSEGKRKRNDQQKILEDEIRDSSTDDRSQALKSFMSSKIANNSKKTTHEKNQLNPLNNQNDQSGMMGNFSHQQRNHPNFSNAEKLMEDDKKKKKMSLTKVPEKPVRDIMSFLIDYAPLKEWELDILGILREEAYYFLPQRLTKIMNEGWASFWHSRIMTQKALRPEELIDYCDHHAGVTQMSRNQLNPYKLGIELFHDIEYRWNTGRFGKDYNECENLAVRESWNTKAGMGNEKIFEVRKTHNDVSFIDEFLTPEFCQRAQLFTYKFNPRTGRNEIDTRDFQGIKQKLLSQLTNFGSPVIEVEDANFQNRGELLLTHLHHGVDLDMNFAADTLKNMFALWKRPVNLQTQYDDKKVIFVFDGREMKPLN